MYLQYQVPSEEEGNSDKVPSEEEEPSQYYLREGGKDSYCYTTEEPSQCYLREGGKDLYCHTTGCSVTNKTLKLQSITSEREVNFTV